LGVVGGGGGHGGGGCSCLGWNWVVERG
jgi:hypothetical protein